jgi:hypothetical protein
MNDPYNRVPGGLMTIMNWILAGPEASWVGTKTSFARYTVYNDWKTQGKPGKMVPGK